MAGHPRFGAGPRLPRAGTVVAAAGLVLLLAGCGSVPGTGSPAVSPSGRGGPGSSQSAGPARHPAGPPRAGSRDQARALARRLITGLTLPAGGRPAVPRPVPALLGHPGQETGGGHTIDLHEFVSIRQSVGSAGKFLLAHVPAGMKWSGNGTASGAGGQQDTFFSETMRRPPAGIYQADLVLSVVPAGGGSLLRADAQVTWFPPRTQAEHVDPARFRAVTVSATLFNSRRHTARRTFTAGAVIARLAQALNSLHADPGLSLHCPLLAGSYRIEFVPAAPAQPPVVAVPSECLIASMSAGGRPQPDLLETGKPIAVITGLLGLKASGAARH